MPRVYPPTKTPAEEKMEFYNLSQRTLDNDAFYMLSGKVYEAPIFKKDAVFFSKEFLNESLKPCGFVKPPKSRWQAIKDFFNQNIC